MEFEVDNVKNLNGTVANEPLVAWNMEFEDFPDEER